MIPRSKDERTYQTLIPIQLLSGSTRIMANVFYSRLGFSPCWLRALDGEIGGEDSCMRASSGHVLYNKLRSV